jgi:hydrogenase expression/formation protein HypC
MADVAFGSIVKQVCTAYVPEADVGDYVIVHVGFAISRLNPAEALRTLSLIEELDGSGLLRAGPAPRTTDGG